MLDVRRAATFEDDFVAFAARHAAGHDGLYAWCRREAEGGNERHSWNPNG